MGQCRGRGVWAEPGRVRFEEENGRRWEKTYDSILGKENSSGLDHRNALSGSSQVLSVPLINGHDKHKL